MGLLKQKRDIFLVYFAPTNKTYLFDDSEESPNSHKLPQSCKK